MLVTAFTKDSKSTRLGTTLYPQYLTVYESFYTTDAFNGWNKMEKYIDWVAETLLPHGYNMVTIDGRLGDST